MDPITHAASGAVAMLAMPRRPATLWAAPLAALAAASPDVDIFFARSPLDFLLLHRGITHSLAFAPLLGLVLACLARPLWRASTPGRWRFAHVWLFMTCMALLHIWLDAVTTYGTMVFLPFSPERVRLNGVFIIDLLLALPLLWALWRRRARRGLMRLVLLWTLAYPALGVGLNALHTAQVTARLTAEGHAVSGVTVLPDALAPLFWRVLYTEEGPEGLMVHSRGLDAMGRFRTLDSAQKAAQPERTAALARQSVVCDAFFRFSLLPVEVPLPEADRASDSESGSMFYDLRFGSHLEWVRKLMSLRPNADIPFKLMVELTPGAGAAGAEGGAASAPEPPRLRRERLHLSDSRRDSQWQSPRPPAPPAWSHWLVGLR